MLASIALHKPLVPLTTKMFQSLAKGERIAAVSSEAFPLLDVGDILEIDGMGFKVSYRSLDFFRLL